MRQVYALAAALCERDDEAFPETAVEASELIGRLREEIGHPAPHLEHTPRRRRQRRNRGADPSASLVAKKLAEELR